jgi:nitrate/nitrite transporter NarK
MTLPTGSGPVPGAPRGWRTAFGATLSLAMAFGTFAPFAVGALGPFLVEDLALSRAQLGTVTTVLFAIGGALSVVVGPLTDRVDGRRMLMTLFAVSALALAGMAVGPGYGGLLAGAAVAGVAVAATNPVTNQLVSTHIPRGSQGVIMGVKQSGVQLGAFLAGGLLPTGARLLGWRGALGMSAAVPLLGMALAALTVQAGPRADHRPLRRGGWVPHPHHRPFVRWLAVYALLMGAGVSAVGAYLPLYGVEALGLSPTHAGLIAGMMGLVGIGARILWSRASERRAGVRRPLLAVAALSVGAVALFWGAAATGAWLAWLGAVAFGATAVAWNAIGMLAIVRQVDTASTGVASGIVLLGFYLGYVVAPVTFGWSVDLTGTYAAGWAGLAATFALAAAVAHRSPATAT